MPDISMATAAKLEKPAILQGLENLVNNRADRAKEARDELIAGKDFIQLATEYPDSASPILAPNHPTYDPLRHEWFPLPGQVDANKAWWLDQQPVHPRIHQALLQAIHLCVGDSEKPIPLVAALHVSEVPDAKVSAIAAKMPDGNSVLFLVSVPRNTKSP